MAKTIIELNPLELQIVRRAVFELALNTSMKDVLYRPMEELWRRLSKDEDVVDELPSLKFATPEEVADALQTNHPG